MTGATATSAAGQLAARAEVFHAPSDPRRLEILHRLAGGERCVCDLQDNLGAAQSLLSFHLKTLREAGLVHVRRSGRWSYYSLAPDALHSAEHQLADLQHALPVTGRPCCTPSSRKPTTEEPA